MTNWVVQVCSNVMEAVAIILSTSNDDQERLGAEIKSASVPEHQRLLCNWNETVADLQYISKQAAGIPGERDGWYRARGLRVPDASTIEKLETLFRTHGSASLKKVNSFIFLFIYFSLFSFSFKCVQHVWSSSLPPPYISS